MITRSKDNERSRWRDFFFACRSAVRSLSGIRVAEFLLPLLVLDSVCFGDKYDETVTVQEIRDALSLNTSVENSMLRNERQKIINAIFMVMDTLQIWAERETEDRHRVSRGSSPSSAAKQITSSELLPEGSQLPWPSDESVARIEDLTNAIPLSVCAKAAARVGMHARAMRLLEMEARSHFVNVYDDTHGEADNDMYAANELYIGRQKMLQGMDVRLAQKVLGCLDDFDTMMAVSEDCRGGLSLNVMDHIVEREMYGDWVGALQGYEQALQISKRSISESEKAAASDDTLMLEEGMLKCLLRLGQLESVLNQVNGMRSDTKCHISKHLLPSAIEAAWRLGNWASLEDLIKNEQSGLAVDPLDTEGQYHISLGRAMLGLHIKSQETVAKAVREARTEVLVSLAGAARESYARAYPYLLRLQSLKELEDASEVLCQNGCNRGGEEATLRAFSDQVYSDLPHGWEWEGRIQLTASEIGGSSAIVNVRLSLSQIAKLPGLEGSLWLTIGKQARKSRLYHIAENYLAHANAACIRLKEQESKTPSSTSTSLEQEVTMQLAKLKYAAGNSNVALRILEQENIQGLLGKEGDNLKGIVATMYDTGTKNASRNSKVNYLAKKILQSTEWLVEGGLKSGSEIMQRFSLVKGLHTSWERAHLVFARYLGEFTFFCFLSFYSLFGSSFTK